jgi:hypothetical protein
MCPEPSKGFYKKFILVREGQRVRKGDVIAYQYLPPSSGDACHIHFHLMVNGLAMPAAKPENGGRRSESCCIFFDCVRGSGWRGAGCPGQKSYNESW